MRFRIWLSLSAAAVAPAVALPALAQSQPQSLEQRVGRVERDLRTVQRRVFPDGTPQVVEPEIGSPGSPRNTVRDAQTGDAIASLTGRVDALEAQVQRVTGMVEEQGFRLRQLEEQVTQLRAAATPAPTPTPTPPRTDPPAFEPEPVRERPTRPTTPAPTPTPTATPAPTPTPTASDPAEAAYNAGYRLWEQRNYGEAQTSLTAAADRYPNSRWASWSRNLAGRAYLDDNKPATAARIFLANYQNNRRGDRAADSLFFLGEALVRLNRQSEACPVYDELEQVFPQMRDFLRQRLPAARTAARCTTRR